MQIGKNKEIFIFSGNVISLETHLVIPKIPNNMALVGAIEWCGINIIIVVGELQKPIEDEDGRMVWKFEH